MNDIKNQNDTNQSNFKVYKDKLSSFVSGFKKNNPQPQNNTQTQQTAPIEKTNETIENAPTDRKSPSLDEIREKIRSQAITNKNQENIPNAQASPDVLNSPHTSIQNEPPPLPKDSKLPKFSTSLVKTAIKVIIITLVALILGYIIVNYQAISLRFKYWYEVDYKHQNWSQLYPITLHKAQSTAQKLDENYLYIPMLDIEAPVNWGVADNDVSGMLSSGLVQYEASALPDDATGNIYIIGSTSGPVWSSSDYKTVFTLLDKAQTDQVITIIYNNKIYSYRIFEIDYLNNSDITISPGSEEQSVLNLIAQYPIGLNWKTLRVRAELFKIQSNIVSSMQDNVDELESVYSESTNTNLNPIEVQPTSTAIPMPTEDASTNPDLLPEHFLPEI